MKYMLHWTHDHDELNEQENVAEKKMTERRTRKVSFACKERTCPNGHQVSHERAPTVISKEEGKEISYRCLVVPFTEMTGDSKETSTLNSGH
jgi:hypothetical protein